MVTEGGFGEVRKVNYLIIVVCIVLLSSVTFAVDIPFQPDKVTCIVNAYSGAIPFNTMFQPAISVGDDGTFFWDWNGDGTWDDSSSGAIPHTYQQPGTYKVKMKFVTDDDKTYVSEEKTITVTDSFVGEISTCSEEAKNTDWQTAEDLSVGDKITTIIKSKGYNFYKIKYIDRGDYVIKLQGASAATLNLGLQISLHDSYTRIIASSGDSNHFGYIVAKLFSDFYYVKVYNPTSSAICYTISLQQWDGRYPSGSHGNFPSKATVYRIHEPEKGVNATQYIAVIKQDGAYKFQINTPIFEKKVDCYIAFSLEDNFWFVIKIDNDGIGYSTNITKFSENSYSPTNGMTIDGFIIPEDLIKGEILSGYLLVVETGTDLDKVDWDNDAYLLQWFTITLN